MAWTNVRLELCPTPDHPGGSVSRAYLLRLPLDDHGVVDIEAYDAMPVYASVRRYWPQEPDRAGRAIRTSRGWLFSYTLPDSDREAILHRQCPHFRLGAQVPIHDDGQMLMFRIMG